MDSRELQTLVQQVRAGTKRQEEAIAKIWETIYDSPFIFGYTNLKDDTRSEFLLSLYPLLPKMIEGYDESRGLFMTYLTTVVKLNAKSWRRRAAKESASRDTATYCYRADHDFSHDLLSASPEPVYTDTEPKPPLQLKVPAAPKSMREKRNSEMILILALKSALYLSDAQIKNVAALTGCDEKTLIGYLERITEKMQKKQVERQRVIESRNQTFFLKSRYRLELNRLQPDTIQFQIVQKQYDYQSRMLEEKNAALHEKYDLAPSSAYLATLLGMHPRRVTRLLEQAKTKDWQPYKEAVGL